MKTPLLILSLALFLAISPDTAMAQKNSNASVPKKENAQSRKGLFGVKQNGDEWFLEIPDSILGRRILTTVRFTTTPARTSQYGGEMISQSTLYWEEAPGNRLLLRADLLINTADSLDAINRAVITSNSNPIIGSFKPESRHNGAYTIKVTSFFNDDNAAFIPSYIKQKLGLQVFLSSSSYIESIKTFPLNTEVRATKTWISSGSRTGKVTLGTNVSFVLLPSNPIIPRLFDPRVGYFTDQYVVYSDNQQEVDAKRFITRWRLEPKDSADMERMKRGELVEPKKPIVYYIDPATPKKWRPYLIQGVNDWQKAFEYAGFKNAIHAEEWPENDSTMSMEDARFSVIRYFASDIPNAYGPQVHDPRTGEILESHIGWYHNVMSLLHNWYMVQAGTLDEAARKMKFDDKLMGELIRFVSSHEVGHTLGLRHNFGSSSTVPVDSLRSKSFVEANGHTPSIMDYARFNYVAQPEDGITQKGIFPRIGDYDKWAIQWGYTPMWNAYDSESDHWELEKLTHEKLKDGNRRLWFGDGETNRTRDSRCQTEDLGDDAVKASEYGLLNLKRELAALPEWTYSSNDIYNKNLSNMYEEILGQFNRYTFHVFRNIGGVYHDYGTVDEGGSRYTNVPRAKQKDCFSFLERHAFSEPTWMIDQPYVKSIVPNTSTITRNYGGRVLSQMLSTGLLLSLNEEYPADEYLSDIVRSLFKEAADGSKVSDYRRFMQAQCVQLLISSFRDMDTMIGGYTSTLTTDLRGTLLQNLKTLSLQLKSAKSADTRTRAHYKSLADIIDRALVIK